MFREPDVDALVCSSRVVTVCLDMIVAPWFGPIHPSVPLRKREKRSGNRRQEKSSDQTTGGLRE
jgi:hypothetical protein